MKKHSSPKPPKNGNPAPGSAQFDDAIRAAFALWPGVHLLRARHDGEAACALWADTPLTCDEALAHAADGEILALVPWSVRCVAITCEAGTDWPDGAGRDVRAAAWRAIDDGPLLVLSGRDGWAQGGFLFYHAAELVADRAWTVAGRHGGWVRGTGYIPLWDRVAFADYVLGPDAARDARTHGRVDTEQLADEIPAPEPAPDPAPPDPDPPPEPVPSSAPAPDPDDATPDDATPDDATPDDKKPPSEPDPPPAPALSPADEADIQRSRRILVRQTHHRDRYTRGHLKKEAARIKEAAWAARSADDIVEVLCRAAWMLEHHDPNPMPKDVAMTGAQLREVLPHVRREIRETVAVRLGTLFAHAHLPAPEQTLVDRCFESPTLEDVHAVWIRSRRRPSTHPAFAVVEAALKLRTAIARIDRGRIGIQPAFLGDLAVPGNVPPTTLHDCGFVSAPGDSWIVDLPDGVTGPAPALILALLDAHAHGPAGGSRVAIRDRLFVEALMAAVPTQRQGIRTVDVPVREVVREWLQWKSYRPSGPKTGTALSRAVWALNGIAVPMNARGGWWKPVNTPRLTGLRFTDRITITLDLPFDSDRGARVDRHALRIAGSTSPVAWRLYLSLCYEWNRIAHKGKVPHLTRPEVRRDDAGHVLGAEGNVLTTRRGSPQTSPYDRRAVRTGEREINPRGEKFHRRYQSAADLVRVIWPLAPQGARLNPGRSEDQAVQAALWLAREDGPDGDPIRIRDTVLPEPAIRIVREGDVTKRNPLGFPWRIVPHYVR